MDFDILITEIVEYIGKNKITFLDRKITAIQYIKAFIIVFFIIVFIIIEESKSAGVDVGKIIYKIKNKRRNYTNYINIAFNIDNNYLYPFIVSLTSLLYNRAQSTFYIIHILTGEYYTHELFDKIKKVIEKFGQNSVNATFYNMGNVFRKGRFYSYITVAATYRMCLPSLLPYLDKIIYLDTDVINFEDLSEMYKIELKDDICFCSQLDHSYHLPELRRFNVKTDKYMNDGIMIMNLKSLRENSIEQKIKKLVETKLLNHHEQTAINVFCHNRSQILPSRYARFSFDSYFELVEMNKEQKKKYRHNESELIHAFYQPSLLHYAGWTKPWHKEYNSSNSAYWWYYAKKSGFYKSILENYNFNKSDIELLLNKIPEYGGLLRKNYNDSCECSYIGYVNNIIFFLNLVLLKILFNLIIYEEYFYLD